MRTYTTLDNHGFSLIELLISMAIFSVVLLMAMGTLLVIIDANAKAQTMQDAMTNLTLAIDSMAREIRTGSGYYCTDASTSKPSEVRFTVQDCESGSALWIIEGGSSLTAGSGSTRIGYRFTTVSGRGVLQRAIGSGSWTNLTADTVNITRGYFSVDDTAFADLQQANVTIYMEGSAGTLANTDSTFSLQTTVEKHIIDL